MSDVAARQANQMAVKGLCERNIPPSSVEFLTFLHAQHSTQIQRELSQCKQKVPVRSGTVTLGTRASKKL